MVLGTLVYMVLGTLVYTFLWNAGFILSGRYKEWGCRAVW